MDWLNVQPSLLDRSLKSHGPLLMQAMMAEQFSSTAQSSASQSSFLVEDSTSLQGSLLNFIAKNGLHLFSGSGQKLEDHACAATCDSDFAHLPALNHFLFPTAPVLKRKFFEDIRPGDVIVAKVTNVETTGLGCLVMCLEGEFELDVYDLDLAVFVDQEELLPPDWDPVKYFNIVRHYSRKDIVRVQVSTIDSERRKLTVLLKNAKNCAGIKMGKISETELPAYFRASFELDGKTRTYNELLLRSEGWRNLACLDNLAKRLGVDEASNEQAVSFLRDMKGVNFAKSEFGSTLRKDQSRRLALRSVRRGVEELRGGKSMEAMQHFNKALQVDEDNVEALVGRGALHANGGAYVLALEDFNKALSVDPTHANAKKYAVETLLNQAQKYRDDYVSKDQNKLQKLLIAVYCRALAMDPACGEARQELMKYGTLSDASPPSAAPQDDSNEAGAVECIPLPPESQSAQNMIEIGEARQPITAEKSSARSIVKSKVADDDVSPTQPGGDIMQRLQAYHQQIELSGMDISIEDEENNSSGNSGGKGSGGRRTSGEMEGKRKSEKDGSEHWSVDAGISKSRKPVSTGISPESVSPTSAGNSSSSSSLITTEKNNLMRKRKKSREEESIPGPSESGSSKKHQMKDTMRGRKSIKNIIGGNDKASGMDRQISITSTVKNEIDSSSSGSSNESKPGGEGNDSDTSTDSSSSTSDTSNCANVRRNSVTKKKIKQDTSSSSSDDSSSDSDSTSSSGSSQSDSSSNVNRTAAGNKSKKLKAKSREKQSKKVELMKLAKKLQSSDPKKVREMYRSLGLPEKPASNVSSKIVDEESLKSSVAKRKDSLSKPDRKFNSKLSFVGKSAEIESVKKSKRLSLEAKTSDRIFDKVTSAPDISFKSGTYRKSVGDFPSASSGKKKPKKQLDPNVAKKLKTLESFMNDLKTKDAELRHPGSNYL